MALSRRWYPLWVRAWSLSRLWLFATPQNVAHQVPLFIGFSRQEYWSGLPLLTPGDLSRPEIKPQSPVSPALARRFLTTMPPRKPLVAPNWPVPRPHKQGLRYKDDGVFYQDLTISPVFTDVQADENIVFLFVFFPAGNINHRQGRRRQMQSNREWWWWWFSCHVMSNSCDPMDCSLPGSSVHELLQARILKWVAISFSMESSLPRNQTRVSCIASRVFTDWATRKP